MSILDELPHRCNIYRRARARDSMIGSKDTPGLEQSDVECWEQAASDREIMEFQKRGMEISRKVYFVDNPAVTSRHQLKITEREGVAVTDYYLDVVSAPEPDASVGLGVVYRVMCRRTTGQTE